MAMERGTMDKEQAQNVIDHLDGDNELEDIRKVSDLRGYSVRAAFAFEGLEGELVVTEADDSYLPDDAEAAPEHEA